jgi:Holliday junction resolvase
MSNKKLGNSFETELCELLSMYGFWCHNMAQNAAGQPADVIAVRNGLPYLIDCKVCSTDKGFDLRRVEENQELAMDLWRECDNGAGWFAMKLPSDEIYMLNHRVIKVCRTTRSYLSIGEISLIGIPIKKWVMKH